MARTQSKNYSGVRDSILKTAARLFATKGYPNTTILDLADACSSSRGALYHYFELKEQILIEIFETHLEAVRSELEAIVATEREAMPAFRSLMRRLMRMNSQNQAEQTTLLNEMNQLDEQTRAKITLKQRQIVDLIVEALSRLDNHGRMTPQNRKVYGMMLLGALNYSYIWYDPAGPIAPELYADMTVDAFITGFAGQAISASPQGANADQRRTSNAHPNPKTSGRSVAVGRSRSHERGQTRKEIV